jgi:hypothetical protein
MLPRLVLRLTELSTRGVAKLPMVIGKAMLLSSLRRFF